MGFKLKGFDKRTAKHKKWLSDYLTARKEEFNISDELPKFNARNFEAKIENLYNDDYGDDKQKRWNNLRSAWESYLFKLEGGKKITLKLTSHEYERFHELKSRSGHKNNEAFFMATLNKIDDEIHKIKISLKKERSESIKTRNIRRNEKTVITDDTLRSLLDERFEGLTNSIEQKFSLLKVDLKINKVKSSPQVKSKRSGGYNGGYKGTIGKYKIKKT